MDRDTAAKGGSSSSNCDGRFSKRPRAMAFHHTHPDGRQPCMQTLTIGRFSPADRPCHPARKLS